MENKKSDFSSWYNEIIDLSGLSDKRYPIKGMNVWLPYGLKVMKGIDRIIRDNVDISGFQEVQFPVLITRDQLSIEFEHVKGFENEVYWVTRGGREPLEVEMALRPTSEAAMYGMFQLWVRAHTDLPLKIYQIVSVYRYETKHTRTFIRIREIHFFEAHTAHTDYDSAEKQMVEYRQIWDQISSELCLPFVVDQRPDWDKFPGAMYTLAFDTAMPGGRSLQIGTIHQYGENFSRNYGIEYLKEDGTHSYVSQTTFGLSERLLAAVIGIHGDDTGLIFPPSIAPVQIVIIPIPSEGADTDSYCSRVSQILSAEGFRVHIDNRDNYTPGFKFNEWEMKGVPLRIEIGGREVRDNKITMRLRTGGDRIKCRIDDLPSEASRALASLKEELRRRAFEHFERSIEDGDSLEIMKKGETMFRFYWCGSKECSDRIEGETGKTVLGMQKENENKGKCLICGKDGRVATASTPY